MSNMKLSNNLNNHRKPALKKIRTSCSFCTEAHRECKQLNPLKERNSFFPQRLILFFLPFCCLQMAAFVQSYGLQLLDRSGNDFNTWLGGVSMITGGPISGCFPKNHDIYLVSWSNSMFEISNNLWKQKEMDGSIWTSNWLKALCLNIFQFRPS